MSKRRRRRAGGPYRTGDRSGPETVDSEPVGVSPDDGESTGDEGVEAFVEETDESLAEPANAEPEPDAEIVPVPKTVADAEQDFGRWLRQQRELRGIDLRSIAEASKISVRYLEAMEENRFDVLPASVFTKGFLRQYALFVGLDPEEVVNFYLDARHRESDAAIDPVVTPPRHRSRSRADNLPWVIGALVLAVAVPVLLWAMSWFSAREAPGDDTTPETPPPVVSTPAPTPEPPETAPPPTPEPASGSELAPEPEPVGSPIRVTLDFSAECWVEADVDGRREVAEMFVQGSSLRLDAESSVYLKVGDVRSVRFQVNGMPYIPEPVVSETSVRRIQIDLDTVARLRNEADEAAPGAASR